MRRAPFAVASLLVALLAPLPAPGLAAAETNAVATLVPAQSEITFQIKQSGVPIDGRFRKFDAQLALDPKAPQTGSVTISVDTGSATVGFAESDAELPRAPWFDSAKFPRAVFQSSAIKPLGGGRLQVAGRLDLKGAANELSVPVTIVRSGTLSTASGEFVVKRLDFKIGEKEWADLSLVANDVRVRFKLVFGGLGAL
ncbi:MAG: YceI family protein [Caldimonas sp.]